MKYIPALILLLGTSCFAATVYEPVQFNENEVVFSEASRPISVTNPTLLNNKTGISFPGGRGANQLVIYTPEFGDRTNTNEFGTEAIVQDNVVTILSGANSFIPENGIVISGHGSAKTWITKNLAIGTKIHIDEAENTIYAYTTSESYMYEAEDKIKETKSMLDFYRGKAPNYAWRESSNHISEAQKYLKEAKRDNDSLENVKKYTELAIKEANSAMETVLPNMPNEVKGVWIRPTETTEAQIISTLDKMQRTGINNVFLETFYHGKTIYPSKVMTSYEFTEQNEQFKGIDPLRIWIAEAHKRGIKVHIWFQSFYVGNTPPTNAPKSILAVHPEWGNKTRAEMDNEGPTRSKSEHNGYFLDPSNPAVHDFLIKLIEEIICTYKPDGINLDYIRYPQSVSKTISGSWGYTEYARHDFQDMYGTDPAEIYVDDMLWKDWENYRREHITNFVRKIGTIGRQKNVYISTVIFPDIENALNTKQQDWRTWSRRSYVNGFTPLFLTYDPKMVASMMQDVVEIKSPSTDLYAGIFVTFMGGSNEDLVKQIHETRKLHANGVILFDWAHTSNQYTQVLASSAFKTSITNCSKQEGKKKRRWIFKKQ